MASTYVAGSSVGKPGDIALSFIARTLIAGGVVYFLDVDGLGRMMPALKAGAAGAAGSLLSQAWVEGMIIPMKG